MSSYDRDANTAASNPSFSSSTGAVENQSYQGREPGSVQHHPRAPADDTFNSSNTGSLSNTNANTDTTSSQYGSQFDNHSSNNTGSFSSNTRNTDTDATSTSQYGSQSQFDNQSSNDSGSFSNTNTSSQSHPEGQSQSQLDSQSRSQTDSQSQSQGQGQGQDQGGYPEQRHAGAVGYGPNYNQGAGLGDKLTGLKEQVMGKVRKDPELAEHGRERRTGELKKKEAEEDMANSDPFKEPGEEKKTSSTDVNNSSSENPTTSDAKTSQAMGSNTTSAPPQPSSGGRRDAQGQEIQAGTVAPEGEGGMRRPDDIKNIDERSSRSGLGSESTGKEFGSTGSSGIGSERERLGEQGQGRVGSDSQY